MHTQEMSVGAQRVTFILVGQALHRSMAAGLTMCPPSMTRAGSCRQTLVSICDSALLIRKHSFNSYLFWAFGKIQCGDPGSLGWGFGGQQLGINPGKVRLGKATNACQRQLGASPCQWTNGRLQLGKGYDNLFRL